MTLPRSANPLVVLTLIAACTAPKNPAASTSPSSSDAAGVVGLWEGHAGGFAEIRQTGFGLWSRRPSSPEEEPLCVGYDGTGREGRVACQLPLLDCRASLSLQRDGSTLRVSSPAPPEGEDCPKGRDPWAFVLTSVEPFEVAQALYLSQVKTLGEWPIGNTSRNVVSTLGSDPHAALASIAGLLRSEWHTNHRGRSAPGLRSLVDWMRMLHYRLITKCGGLPGSEACTPEAARALATELLSPQAPPPEMAKPPDVRRTPAQGAPGLLGVWLGPYAEIGAATGYIEVEKEGADLLRWSFAPSAPFDLRGGETECSQATKPTDHVTLDCGRCGRRLRIERTADALVVIPLGRGWTDTKCGGRAAVEHLAFRYDLRAADPFAAMTAAYVRSAKRSDLGSSGGNIMFAVLGREPHEAVRSLATRVKKAYAESGRDPETLTLRSASEMVLGAQMILMRTCQGVLPDARYEVETSGCAQARIDNALHAVVQERAPR